MADVRQQRQVILRVRESAALHIIQMIFQIMIDFCSAGIVSQGQQSLRSGSHHVVTAKYSCWSELNEGKNKEEVTDRKCQDVQVALTVAGSAAPQLIETCESTIYIFYTQTAAF